MIWILIWFFPFFLSHKRMMTEVVCVVSSVVDCCVKNRLVPLNNNQIWWVGVAGNFQTNTKRVILKLLRDFLPSKNLFKYPFFSRPLLCACVLWFCLPFFPFLRIQYVRSCIVVYYCSVCILYDVNCLFTMFWFRYKKSK